MMYCAACKRRSSACVWGSSREAAGTRGVHAQQARSCVWSLAAQSAWRVYVNDVATHHCCHGKTKAARRVQGASECADPTQ